MNQGPLNNPKHEAFVQEYARQLKDPNIRPSATSAYQKIYSIEDPKVAGAAAPRVLERVSVKNRLLELIEEDEELNDSGIKKHLRNLVLTAKDGVKLGTIQTVMKLKGQLSDGTNSLQQNNIANVSFNEITINNSLPSAKPQDVVSDDHDTQ